MAQHAHALASFGTPVGTGLFSNVRAQFTARRTRMLERARIRRELESYTDRQLSDLGLSRMDIPAVLDGAYSR